MKKSPTPDIVGNLIPDLNEKRETRVRDAIEEFRTSGKKLGGIEIDHKTNRSMQEYKDLHPPEDSIFSPAAAFDTQGTPVPSQNANDVGNFEQSGLDTDDDDDSDWENDHLKRKRRNMSIRGKPKKHNEDRTKVFFFSLLI